MLKQLQRFKEEKQRSLKEVENLYKITSKYKEDMELFHDEEVYWRFVLRRAVLTTEMLIHWADECIEELKNKESAE